MKSMTRPIPEPKPASPGAPRVLIVVLDGAGVGALPDASRYGDQGADTLGHLLRGEPSLELPHLFSLGLGEILGLETQQPLLPGCHGRLAPRSPGKDTTSGHWELAGVVLDRPFPVYPRGFPPEVMEPFERAVGKKALGNKPASGTEIIQELGAAHLESGRPIVYTSADSVFQIAAHEEGVPREQLYQWCRIAREILQGPHAVGRVIARPFVGSPGQFRRTGGRRDFSLSPPAPTILDRAREAGFPVAVTGKVADIFNHRGISRQEPGSGNEETAASLFRLVEELESGLIWATFGDFDTLYGHRNDRRGFAAALERFDEHLSCLLERLREEDLLIITADHGCDPQHPGTDHTREYVPLMATGRRFRNRVDLGTGSSLADVGAGAARWLGLDPPPQGSSFLDYADLG